MTGNWNVTLLIKSGVWDGSVHGDFVTINHIETKLPDGFVCS